MMAHFGLYAPLPAKRRNMYVRDTLVASAARHTIQPIRKGPLTVESCTARLSGAAWKKHTHTHVHCSKRATGLSAENPNNKKETFAGPVLGHLGWEQAPGSATFGSRVRPPSMSIVLPRGGNGAIRGSYAHTAPGVGGSARATNCRPGNAGTRGRVFPATSTKVGPDCTRAVVHRVHRAGGYRYQELRMRTPKLSIVPPKVPWSRPGVRWDERGGQAHAVCRTGQTSRYRLPPTGIVCGAASDPEWMRVQVASLSERR
ncbi:hypothetical protein EDB84DRAFT_1676531 [Lactarius hengduanensis]|nr:hypothetical protein EDB84DRAFT_1676531 [Lactarius hengduanensis]